MGKHTDYVKHDCAATTYFRLSFSKQDHCLPIVCVCVMNKNKVKRSEVSKLENLLRTVHTDESGSEISCHCILRRCLAAFGKKLLLQLHIYLVKCIKLHNIQFEFQFWINYLQQITFNGLTANIFTYNYIITLHFTRTHFFFDSHLPLSKLNTTHRNLHSQSSAPSESQSS